MQASLRGRTRPFVVLVSRAKQNWKLPRFRQDPSRSKVGFRFEVTEQVSTNVWFGSTRRRAKFGRHIADRERLLRRLVRPPGLRHGTQVRDRWLKSGRVCRDGRARPGLALAHRDRERGPNQSRPNATYSLTPRNRKAFVMTETLDRLIAAAAIIGDMSSPVTGYRTPAATGMPKAL